MVRARHDEIQKIERDFVELAQLFQDLDTLVVQQEDSVKQIEQGAEDVNQNVTKGNTEIDTAITSARSARRKKWWCLLITGKCWLFSIVTAISRLMLYSYYPYHHRCCDRSCGCGHQQPKELIWPPQQRYSILDTRICPRSWPQSLQMRLSGYSHRKYGYPDGLFL